jgi:internalin A
VSSGEAMEIAKARVAEESKRQTGSLDLSHLLLDALPEESASLTGLRQLDCSFTGVRGLTPLSGLAQLQKLDCSFTRVTNLTPLSGLAQLQYLDCGGTKVRNLTPLSGLAKLQELSCRETSVSDLTPLSGLAILEQLDCSWAQASDLTPLSGLAQLQQLNCWHTPVSDLTPLAGLAQLQGLSCRETSVSDLTPLSGLAKLGQLDCSFTRVSDLMPLSGLAQLQHLDCSATLVIDLTPLSGLAKLQLLDCGSTSVSDLVPLSGLGQLQLLNCSLCRLGALPAFIRENAKLTLIAFNARVPGLPHGVLSRNYDDDCRARVKAHYDDLAKGAADLTDVKLLLLGNGGAGKTQIARWLAGAAFETEWDSTHGIQIVIQAQPGSIAARLHLQMWDFGGQDIYHGTHVMFLRGPAVLMPIWAKDRENRETYDYGGLTFRNHPLAYWIDVVKHQASEASPALIVQSKCDQKQDEERRFPVSEDALKALPYATELHVSPKTDRGRGALEDALQDAILWLRDPDRLGVPQIGAGRLRVQRRLEAMRDADSKLPREQRINRLLERQDFDAICAEEGVSSPEALLHYLDTNGTVIFRPGLFGRIVLDQSWALEAIYAVFDRKRVYSVLCNDEGRFSRAKLGLLVWQEHSDDEQKLLLSMMVSCGMCFEHRRFSGTDDANTEYIAPDMLADRDTVAGRLASRWAEDRPSEQAVFRYALLHGGLIRSVMAEIGEVAGVDGLYWRGGLCVFDTDTHGRLLIEEEMTGDWQGAIRIRTQDGQAATLLQKAIKVIEGVQTRLSLQPTDVERPSPPVQRPEPAAISPGQEKPKMAEWYVSYAWGDDHTPEGRAREKIVDQLCDAAAAQGYQILRDKNVLGLGDSISAFMRRIGTGDRVFVILSDKYLRSPFCMFELSEIWRTSKQEGKAFLDRVRVYVLDDVSISKAVERTKWAIHWKTEYDQLNELAIGHGPTVLGEDGQRQLMQMQRFYTQTADILATIADRVYPRTFEQLQRYGFADKP